MKEQRLSNIELLKILAVFGVIVMNYIRGDIGGAISFAADLPVNFLAASWVESIFSVGVNILMLISGYLVCQTYTKSLWKPIKLIIQVIIFNGALFIVSCLLKHTPLTLKAAAENLLPGNYFVLIYIAVYVLSPFINVLLDKLSQKQFKILLIAGGLMFSAFEIIANISENIAGVPFTGFSFIGISGGQAGYTVVNFLFMYLIGAYMRKYNPIKLKSRWLLLIFLGNTVIMVVWALVDTSLGLKVTAWNFCSPLVIVNAVLIFAVFERIKMKKSPVINKLAESIFTAFLLHITLLQFFEIEKFAVRNVGIMLLHMLATSVAVYMICWLVYLIYSFFTNLIYRAIEKKHKLIFIDLNR
ncbi:MAG: acyltransferase family protein [Parasporobacterium sp.]|nr:acyltransferase family protein [Parasporobacterium sp.]